METLVLWSCMLPSVDGMLGKILNVTCPPQTHVFQHFDPSCSGTLGTFWR